MDKLDKNFRLGKPVKTQLAFTDDKNKRSEYKKMMFDAYLFDERIKNTKFSKNSDKEKDEE